MHASSASGSVLNRNSLALAVRCGWHKKFATMIISVTRLLAGLILTHFPPTYAKAVRSLFTNSSSSTFYQGYDLSSLTILEEGGAVYKDTQRNNATRPAEDILIDGGMNTARLRCITMSRPFYPNGNLISP